MALDDMRIVDANVVLRVTPNDDGKSIQRKTFPGVWTMSDMQGSFQRPTWITSRTWLTIIIIAWPEFRKDLLTTHDHSATDPVAKIDVECWLVVSGL